MSDIPRIVKVTTSIGHKACQQLVTLVSIFWLWFSSGSSEQPSSLPLLLLVERRAAVVFF